MSRLIALVFSLLIVFAVDTGPAGAQDTTAGDEAERGRVLFDRHCRSCHKADKLVQRLYPAGTPPRMDVCAFLQGHRRAAGARDCAIVVYLEDLARQPAQ